MTTTRARSVQRPGSGLEPRYLDPRGPQGAPANSWRAPVLNFILYQTLAHSVNSYGSTARACAWGGHAWIPARSSEAPRYTKTGFLRVVTRGQSVEHNRPRVPPTQSLDSEGRTRAREARAPPGTRGMYVEVLL
eukprot:2518164-Pyramimonas_sp.AAC.1